MPSSFIPFTAQYFVAPKQQQDIRGRWLFRKVNNPKLSLKLVFQDLNADSISEKEANKASRFNNNKRTFDLDAVAC